MRTGHSTAINDGSLPASHEIPVATIQSFLQDYCHTLDDGEIDNWVGFFKEDATYQITTRENRVKGYPIGIVLCEGRGMMNDRIKALKNANIFESHTYCHILGYPSIRSGDQGLLAVRTNFVVYRTMYTGEAELFASGKYLDLIAQDNDGPRFAERLVVLDSRRIDTLLVYPL